jgi:hypothetical protein
MVADPFVSMADTMLRVADDMRVLVQAHGGKPAPGSVAAKECDGDPFRGEWGRPTMAVVGSVVLSASACHDHLRAASILVRSRAVTLSPHTVIRGAAEAAALGSYLTDPDADQRERVRRGVNARLAGLCQERLALRRFAGSEPDAAAKIAGIEQTLGRFERSAAAHGFAFAAADGFRPAYLDAKTPSTTELLGLYVFPGTATLGRAYYSGLSSVAHSQLNGLIRRVLSDGAGGAGINATAKDTALDLLAGPLAASTLVQYMVPWLGWDPTALNASIPAMFDLWGQIADAPYPGPVSGGLPDHP